jgi:TetR/AcrR family transcriptional regulator, transcriptional repressor for nem operon
MPKRSLEQAAQSREKIIASAGELMRANGFDGVGIDAISAHAGLTAGAFYKHFASKQALLEELVSRAMHEAAKHLPTIVTVDDITTFVAAYMAQRKFKQTITGCIVASMAPDLSRNGETVRLHTVQYIESIHEAITRALIHDRSKKASEIAWQIMAAAIGGVILARLMRSPIAAQIDAAVVDATKAIINRRQ